MQRVAIVGCPGAGKSVLARALGRATGLPVVHLDVEYWRPAWVRPDKQAWLAKVDQLVARDRWILDGNYRSTMAVRLRHADTVVWLDFATWRCLWGCVRRRFTAQRSDRAQGCTERLTLSLLRFVWTYRKVDRPKVLALVDDLQPTQRLVWLRSPAQARRFVRG